MKVAAGFRLVGDRVASAWVRHFNALVLVSLLLGYVLIYTESAFGPPLRSDGEGYYATLASWAIHGDPSFEKLADAQYGGEMPGYTFVERVPATGRYMSTYNIGVSIMMAPLFLVGHWLTWLFQSPEGAFDWWKFNHPADGYSFFYQHALGLGGLFYYFIGFVLLRRELERHVGAQTAVVAMTLLLFGTSWFHYASVETTLSHPYTFLLLSTLLPVSRRWHEEPGHRGLSVVLGLLVGLLVLVRSVNILLLPLFVLYDAQPFSRPAAWVARYARRWRDVLVAGGVAALCLVPQFFVWHYATGHFLVNAYREHFVFKGPQLLEFFFSIRKGLLTWYPLAALSLAGFYFLPRRVPGRVAGMAVTLSLYVLVMSSYYVWWGGGGFGNRYLVDLWPVLAFPLAALLAEVKGVGVRICIYTVAVVCVLWALFLMKLYWTHEIGIEGLDRQALFDILWLRGKAVEAWLGW
jgi:hypothetical protein